MKMLDKKDIIEAVSAIVGFFISGFVTPHLPSFSYSQVVYGLVGLVVTGVGFGIDGLVGSFTIGLGLGLSTSLVTYIGGMVSSGGA